MTILALLAVLGLQDPLDRALADLDGDDPFARERAERELVEAGPRVLSRIEPLVVSGDAELRIRAARIVRTIKDSARKAPVLGPVVRVTLELEGIPFREALRRLEEASGFQVRVNEDVEDRLISLTLRETPFLESISRLCRAHGEVRMADERRESFLEWVADSPSRRARFVLARGKTPNEPALNQGPFRISVSRIVQERRTDGSPNFWLDVRCLWQPNVRPIGRDNLVVTTLLDSQGGSLLKQNELRAPEQERRPNANLYGSTSPLLLQRLPGPDADRIALLRGRLNLWFAFGHHVLKIDRPREVVGAEREIGDFSFAFERFGPAQEGESVTLKIGRRPGSLWANLNEVPQDLLWVRFLDAQSRRVSWSWSGGSSASKRWGFKPDRFDAIAAAEVHAYSDFFNVEIPFELRDIPLPRW